MTESIRLAKRVAEIRACSRREAEQIIAGGWVKVAGIVVEEPQFRVTDQLLEIDPEANPEQTEPVTLLLHKPPGYFTSHDDGGQAATQLLEAARLWPEDASGIRPLKMHFSRLAVCTPLETSAGGLVVYTQDWRVARKLTETAATVEHELVVEVDGELAPDGLKRLNQGIRFNDRVPAAIKVSWQNETRLRIALKGAQPGQVAHMCETVGLNVLALKRIRLGSVPLGKLPPGQWRYLRAGERF